jgi:hypothetical protein
MDLRPQSTGFNGLRESKVNVKQDENEEPVEKHPLSDTWVMTFDDCQQGFSHYQPILEFNTVEDFWCLYNNLTSPADFQKSFKFQLFKKVVYFVP